MSNALLAFPNLIDSTFYNVRLFGGAWDNNLNINNLKNRLFSESARSNDLTLASTQFELDLGTERTILASIIPRSNISTSGKIRTRYSNTAKFVGVTLASAVSIGDTTIDVQTNSVSDIAISTGDFISINGGQTLKVTSGAVINSLSNGTITISSAVDVAGAINDSLVCHSGDFTSTVYDTGWEDVWPEIYPWDSDVLYGTPEWYDRKINAEDAQETIMPSITIDTQGFIARYGLIEIDDQTNPDGYIDLERFFVSPGWILPINISYGSSLGFEDNTEKTTSKGGASFYDESEMNRIINFNIDGLTLDQGMSRAYEVKKQLGTSKQLFFCLDPDNTIHRHRWSFLTTLNTLTRNTFSGYNRIGAPFELIEVIA